MFAALVSLLLAAPDLDALAQEYLTAAAARRAEIRKELAGHDELKQDDVDAWKGKLTAWGRKTGRKISRRKGTP